MSRLEVFDADVLLGEKVDVHDHGGVALLDYMGGDQAIVDAARVSFRGHREEERTEEQDRRLIGYLMKNRHTTPFEMVELKFWVKVPMFIWRHWIRHRTANVNEISGRYAELSAEFYVPRPDKVQKQSDSNKQGRAAEAMEYVEDERNSFRMEGGNAFGTYQRRLARGMAKELARINLPLSTYTEAIWKTDLHNLFHLLRLRLDSHAQWEFQEYARAMVPMVQSVAPMAWAAFEKHVLNTVTVSREEYEALERDAEAWREEVDR